MNAIWPCCIPMLWNPQGVRRTWHCGAYFEHGLHEDGLQAGLAVAEQPGGISRPWNLPDPNTWIHCAAVGHDSVSRNRAA